MSPFWISLKLRVMEVAVTTGAISRAKLQSNHHHQQTNIQFFTGRIPFLSSNQQCQSTEGKQSDEGLFLKILMTRNIQRQTYAVDSAEGAGTKHAALSKF